MQMWSPRLNGTRELIGRIRSPPREDSLRTNGKIVTHRPGRIVEVRRLSTSGDIRCWRRGRGKHKLRAIFVGGAKRTEVRKSAWLSGSFRSAVYGKGGESGA